MTDTNNTRRALTLHAFASAKGGVGKSTLAVMTARAWGEIVEGADAVVFDADMTGTSLGDNLPLEAPEMTREDGSLDLASGQRGWLSRDETRTRRALRRIEDGPRQLPYLNDLLLAEDGTAIDVWACGWRAPGVEQVRFFPSSPLEADYDSAVGWTSEDGRWDLMARLWALVMKLAEQRPSLRHVVFDLPPGLFGIAHAALTLLAELSHRRVPPGFVPLLEGLEIQVLPTIVMTPDRGDMLVACEAFVSRKRRLTSLRLLVNRNDTSPEDVKRTVGEVFAPDLPGDPYGLRGQITTVREDPRLRRIFRDAAPQDMDDATEDVFRQLLES